jgi:hypothetical protein
MFGSQIEIRVPTLREFLQCARATCQNAILASKFGGSPYNAGNARNGFA